MANRKYTGGCWYILKIRVREGLHVEPTAKVFSNISLILKEDMFDKPKVTEVDNSFISSFCIGNNKEYKANTASAVAKEAMKKREEEAKLEELKKQFEDNLKNNFSVQVYPNPATTSVFLQIKNIEDENYTFNITNMNGKVVLKENVSGKENPHFSIDVSLLSAGVYILQVSTKNNEGVRKKVNYSRE